MRLLFMIGCYLAVPYVLFFIAFVASVKGHEITTVVFGCTSFIMLYIDLRDKINKGIKSLEKESDKRIAIKNGGKM